MSDVRLPWMSNLSRGLSAQHGAMRAGQGRSVQPGRCHKALEQYSSVLTRGDAVGDLQSWEWEFTGQQSHTVKQQLEHLKRSDFPS